MVVPWLNSSLLHLYPPFMRKRILFYHGGKFSGSISCSMLSKHGGKGCRDLRASYPIKHGIITLLPLPAAMRI